MPYGPPDKPPGKSEINVGSIVTPDVVYSPTVPALGFVINKSDPETAKKVGSNMPEISLAFTVAPEVVYSPTNPESG